MKIISSVLIIIATGITHGTSGANIDSIKNILEGKWNWTYTLISNGNIVPPDSIGMTYKIEFYKRIQDSTNDSIAYYYFKNDTLINSGVTSIEVYNGQTYMDPKLSPYFDFFEFKNDSLVFKRVTGDPAYYYFNKESSTSAIKNVVNNQDIGFSQPGIGNLLISLKNPGKTTSLHIYSSSGVLVRSQPIYSGQTTFTLTDLSSAIYFAHIYRDGRIAYRKKLVVIN